MKKGKREAKKPKWKAINKILVGLAVFLAVFILAMIVIFCVKGSTPDTLISCVLDAGKYEAVICGAIKLSNVWTGRKAGERETDGTNLEETGESFEC